MRWTCPKCGKKLEISNEQLIANDGMIVCPQCLLQSRLPIPKARITPRQEKSATPPPIKTGMKQSSPARRPRTLNDNSGSFPARTTASKKTSKKRSGKKKKKKQGMSAWGCLGRTVVFTLVLFAAYVFFGLLLEALQ